MGLHRLPGGADEAGGRGVGLPAAPAAAGAFPTATVGDHVPGLHSGVVEAGEEPAVQHGPGTHAGAQRHGHQGAEGLSGPGGELPQGGGVGVIFQQGGQGEALLHQLGQRHMIQPQIESMLHHSRCRIDGAGRGHAHRPGRLRGDPGGAAGLPGGLRNGVCHRFGAPGRGAAELAQQTARLVRQSGGHVGAAQVDSDIVHIYHPVFPIVPHYVRGD